ncbi:MAG: hypothetical protein ACM3MK_00935 [Chitinophagales bacterium]
MAKGFLFRGIIEEVGRVTDVTPKAEGHLLLVIQRTPGGKEVQTGDHIAVNGVCLTVADANDLILSFNVWPATITRTALPNLKPGDMVNLETNKLESGDGFPCPAG